MFYRIIAFLILLFLSAFFSGSETSLFSLSKIRVKRLKVDNIRNAGLVESLLSKPTNLLITILIGNMFANVFAAGMAASLSVKTWGGLGMGISIIVMTVIVVIFCEIMPKIIAIKNSARASLVVSPFINAFSKLVFPLRWLLSGLVNNVLFSCCKRFVKAESDITKAELESAIKMGYSKGGILDKEEAEMMGDVLKLSDKTVGDVMVHKKGIVSFPLTMPVEEMCVAIKEAELSRIPVYGKSRTDIVGILYAKDLLKKKTEDRLGGDIKTFLREPFYVKMDMRLSALLREFRTKKIHFALVKDKSEKVVGLVTLEDLLEEIIGEIGDKETLIQRIRNRYKYLSFSE